MAKKAWSRCPKCHRISLGPNHDCKIGQILAKVPDADLKIIIEQTMARHAVTKTPEILSPGTLNRIEKVEKEAKKVKLVKKLSEPVDPKTNAPKRCFDCDAVLNYGSYPLTLGKKGARHTELFCEDCFEDRSYSDVL